MSKGESFLNHSDNLIPIAPPCPIATGQGFNLCWQDLKPLPFLVEHRYLFRS